MRGGEVTFLPAVRLLDELAVRIVNVDGHFGGLDFRSEPEPIFVSFEELLTDRFLFGHAEIAAPIILADLEAVFHIRFRRLERERLRVVHRGARNRSERKNTHKPKTQATE